jgi:hypothetical protein
VSKLEEVKAATSRLDPDDQYALFKWWTGSEVFKNRQLASLKSDISEGIAQFEEGRYRTYDNESLLRLAEEIGQEGRKRLEGGASDAA